MTGIDRETRRRRGALGVVMAAMLAVFALAVAPQTAAQDGPPDNNAPITLEVTRDSERAALTWTRGGDPADASGCETSHYRVMVFRYDDSGTVIYSVNTLIDDSIISYEVTGLTPKTDYIAQVNPYSEACLSYSPEIAVEYFKTKKAKKNDPATQIAGTQSDSDGDGGGNGNNDPDNTNDDSDESNDDSDDTGNGPGNVDGDGGGNSNLNDDDDNPGTLGDDDGDGDGDGDDDQPDGEENDVIPQPTAPLSPFTAVSTSYGHACGLHADGSISCWGDDEGGQVTPPTGVFKAVTTGGEENTTSHSCAIRTDDTAVCWGQNPHGEASAPAGTFKAISAGGNFTCGIRTNDTLACWGANNGRKSSPPGGTFKTIDAGATHACAIRTDDTVACWGGNQNFLREFVGQANPPSGAFKAVSAGYDHTCALQMNGAISCWGDNGRGQSSPPAGTGFKTISADFRGACAIRGEDTAVCWGWISSVPTGEFKAIELGHSYACAIPADDRIIAGSLICWGSDYAERPEPLNYRYRSISGGWGHFCGVRGNRTIECWGVSNGSGQLDAPEGTFKAKPHHIAAGSSFACAIRQGGALACWGSNDFGKSTPPQGKFTAVTAGDNFACAIRKNDKSISCWGNNEYGQLNAPKGQFTAIDAGDDHVCGLRENGKIACWGVWTLGPPARNSAPKGQYKALGISEGRSCSIRLDDTIDCWGGWHGGHNPPAGKFQAMASGYAHICAIRLDGTVACWGNSGSPPAGVQFLELGANMGQTCGIVDNGRRTGEVVCFSTVYRPDGVNWVEPGVATTDG